MTPKSNSTPSNDITERLHNIRKNGEFLRNMVRLRGESKIDMDALSDNISGTSMLG